MIKELISSLRSALSRAYKSFVATPVKLVIPADTHVSEKKKYDNSLKITRHQR